MNRISSSARVGTRSFWIALPACLALACGSTTVASSDGGTTIDPANAASCQTPGRTGKVDCRDEFSCSAGTYCYTNANNFVSCQTGCTSDQNCGSSERCEKCGKSVGSCVNCAAVAADACKAPVAPPPDDAGGPPPGWCQRSNFDDHYCNEGGRQKAYQCDNDAEPAKELDCAHPEVGPPWVYCCAK